MSTASPVYISGGLGQAVEMAVFMILVSVILAVFWYIIIWVLGALFKPKSRQGMNYGNEYLEKSLEIQTVPRGREASQDNRPAGRGPTSGPY